MSSTPTSGRLADAALDLFEERGYDSTTVDDIAERAGVGRSTFFRYYRSKEGVILPDHERLRRLVAERLATSTHRTAVAAVTDAVRLVMQHYVAEGERARRRYRLTSSNPVLRDREIVSVAPYQRLFREYVVDWLGHGPGNALRAELMAAAVVAAHNHVLRRWLRGTCHDPLADVDTALRQVITLFTSAEEDATGGGTTVVAFRSSLPLEELTARLGDLVDGAQGSPLTRS